MIWKVDLFGVDSKEVSSCGIRLKKIGVATVSIVAKISSLVFVVKKNKY